MFRFFKKYNQKKESGKKITSLFLALLIVVETCWPTASMALTGGPSQPEVQSFEPIGTSDMVDLFSGDFSYNIPLFEADGYPMNLSYHSGISMEQEASWTGLGWNINAGVINRNMRGLPDDFDGDLVIKEQNVKKNMTLGVSCGFSGEFFGYPQEALNGRIGIKYNNYNGIGMERSLNISLSTANKFGGKLGVGLGINSSSDDGLSLQPSISLTQQLSKSDDRNSAGVKIGASYNSRGGLKALTISPELKSTTSKNAAVLSRAVGDAVSSKFDFGQQTYSPGVDFPMDNLSVTAELKLGAEITGFSGAISPMANFAVQKQSRKSLSCPAYGYMNAHNGQGNENAMMDFNREKDGSFTPTTFNLPITNQTFDIYSVSGQGTGGSYRPFRSDVGHVFDIASGSTSDGYSASVEVGAGNISKYGANFVVNSAYSQSGNWSDSKIAEKVRYSGTSTYPDYEPYYFKEANEKTINNDPSFVTKYGGYGATKFDLDGTVKFDAKATGAMSGTAGGGDLNNAGTRVNRDKRGQVISTLSNYEVFKGMGLFGASGSPNTYVTNNISAVGHHIGQITNVGTDGRRYVYAIPAYNLEQQEITFAVGKPVGGGNGYTPNSEKLVGYSPSDITVNNNMGLDNYFQNTKMPAFAHSYMLSAVLSSDYVDVTGNGPSDDDLGNYVLFEYDEPTSGGSNPYHWRTPFEQNKAQFSDGLMADENDDKANLVYGKKQLFFLKKITTKNYTADFVLSDRKDAQPVAGINGGMGTAGLNKKLDKIVLKAKASGKVIKTVNFEYDYFLCSTGGTSALPNNNGQAAVAPETNNQGGKLTLKKVYFTYQDSYKGAYNAYGFTYASNPGYSHVKADRWGNYKGSSVASDITGCVVTPPTDFYPYVNQYEGKVAADNNAAAWHLSKIDLPSGGEINVDFEADDYAYVQDKQATQMYLGTCANTAGAGNLTSLNSSNGFKVYVPSGYTNLNDYLPENNIVYFKFYVELAPGKWDYVPGYAKVNPSTSGVSGNILTLKFDDIVLDDKPAYISNLTNPIKRAALQYGRLNVPRVIWNQPNASASISQQAIMAIVNSGFSQNLQQAVQGPNSYLSGSLFRCDSYNPLKSWVKLKNVTGKKYGGGSRVRKITVKDNFNSMTGAAEPDSEYGQVYDYTKTEGSKTISSGVAISEPQVGGEESALKEPFFFETKHLLAPDEDHYSEAPFGESFYPSAGVGYSQVTVSNYIPTLASGKTLKQHGTGKVINQFYTARDFPTISERTQLQAIQHKSDPFSISTLLSINSKDYMTASQGFYVELNDMHGKPKANYVVNSYNDVISSVEYFYKSTSYGNGSKRLVNTVKSIKPNGAVTSSDVGVFFDAVADLRQQNSESESYGLNINFDSFYLFVPIITIVPIPSYSSDKTQFRSAVMTKVVQRFGILDKTIAKKDGSTVTTSDLAYDAETGEVLLNQTINDFNDPVYSFKYPAYWYYGNMGSAATNIGYKQSITVVAGSAVLAVGANLFKEGDEVELIDGSGNYIAAWVTKSLSNKIELRLRSGAFAANGSYTIKVLRSGMRNMQTMEMANITTLVNPINGVANNVYQKVISAKAIEFGDRWRENCDCKTPTSSSNPFVQGINGNWRPLRSYEYLTDRTQTNTNTNSNVRVDGVYASYNPFYRNFGGKWGISPNGWTFATQVTEFNPYSQELENKDALNRYSAATYGFNQTLATAIGSNSRYSELAFDGFEDYALNSCADKHFKMPVISGNAYYTSADAHTGRYSFNVNTSVEVTKRLTTSCGGFDEGCDISVKYVSANARYEVFNGTAPYTFDYEVINGSGYISVSNDGAGFKVLNPTGNFKANVYITDKAGCKITKLLVAPYTN